MHLRHVPLFLTRELARQKGAGRLVADTLEQVVSGQTNSVSSLRSTGRPEGAALCGREARVGKGVHEVRRLPAGEVQPRKHGKTARRAVPVPRQAEKRRTGRTWKKLVENTLESPDTWEVALSAGKDKRETWERLLREGKVGGMAVLRNLRLMLAAGVPPKLIAERLEKGIARALPFRFVTAARYAPKLEEAIETAMLKSVAGFETLPGVTGWWWTFPARWMLRSHGRARPRGSMPPRAWRSCFARKPRSFASRRFLTLALRFLPGAGSLCATLS
jgi:hypothetical protein